MHLFKIEQWLVNPKYTEFWIQTSLAATLMCFAAQKSLRTKHKHVFQTLIRSFCRHNRTLNKNFLYILKIFLSIYLYQFNLNLDWKTRFYRQDAIIIYYVFSRSICDWLYISIDGKFEVGYSKIYFRIELFFYIFN